jgi:hypothetical protein
MSKTAEFRLGELNHEAFYARLGMEQPIPWGLLEQRYRNAWSYSAEVVRSSVLREEHPDVRSLPVPGFEEALDLFVVEVERRAEANMLKTGKLEGSHYAAMKQVQVEMKEARKAKS